MEKRDKTEVSDKVIDNRYAGYQYDEEIGDTTKWLAISSQEINYPLAKTIH
ncbi:hypothetical protein P9D71_01050 [Bacillus spizizenii]|nr:hypothetical protein [Bacillus spizizenii]MEC1433349.1 hypothetical protein [Bacillus spizizenii]